VDLSLKGTPVGAKRSLYRFAYVPNSTYMNNAAAQSATSRAWMCCAPALATLLEMLLRAQHPPAAATTLLVALGSFHPNWHDATLIISGVVLVIGAGMLLRGVHGKLIAR
jgi:HPP family protein